MIERIRLPPIRVEPLEQATRILCSEDRTLRHVISICDPGMPSPDGLGQYPARKLKLRFHDVERAVPEAGYVPVARRDVERLIRFCRCVDGPTLVHCRAGISRSPAAAFILCCVLLGSGREDEAMVHVMKAAPERTLLPNRRMVWIADDLLGRNGAMKATHREHVAGRYLEELVIDDE